MPGDLWNENTLTHCTPRSRCCKSELNRKQLASIWHHFSNSGRLGRWLIALISFPFHFRISIFSKLGDLNCDDEQLCGHNCGVWAYSSQVQLTYCHSVVSFLNKENLIAFQINEIKYYSLILPLVFRNLTESVILKGNYFVVDIKMCSSLSIAKQYIT